MQTIYEHDANVFVSPQSTQIDVNESSNNQESTWNGRQVSVKSQCFEKTVMGSVCCFGVSAIASAVTGLCLKVQKDVNCIENNDCESGPTTPIKVMAGMAIGFLGLSALGAIYISYKTDRYKKQMQKKLASEVEMANPS